ncbi:hypothetical protein [Tenacibaculum sp. M341]|uniref:hypothetical protein n=1 Tax=Tenacibaculum sp. M341 TaxID=2530339 RepID=UPI00104C0013|nr:hypothetical protein [Tenacibaculum sp. M341]TCI90735.1 hypothetical protein EYW44_13520 [Tenacibaculum sp. M341]
MERIRINLDQLPSQRWEFLKAYKEQVNNLLEPIFRRNTFCKSHQRVSELLKIKPPVSVEDYFSILSDDNVKMNITVQQMVFDVTTGAIHLKT